MVKTAIIQMFWGINKVVCLTKDLVLNQIIRIKIYHVCKCMQTLAMANKRRVKVPSVYLLCSDKIEKKKTNVSSLSNSQTYVIIR